MHCLANTILCVYGQGTADGLSWSGFGMNIWNWRLPAGCDVVLAMRTRAVFIGSGPHTIRHAPPGSHYCIGFRPMRQTWLRSVGGLLLPTPRLRLSPVPIRQRSTRMQDTRQSCVLAYILEQFGHSRTRTSTELWVCEYDRQLVLGFEQPRRGRWPLGGIYDLSHFGGRPSSQGNKGIPTLASYASLSKRGIAMRMFARSTICRQIENLFCLGVSISPIRRSICGCVSPTSLEYATRLLPFHILRRCVDPTDPASVAARLAPTRTRKMQLRQSKEK